MKAPVRRRDLVALGGSLVVIVIVVAVVLRVRAAGDSPAASQWQGYISVVATALVPLSWLAVWWSSARPSNAPAGPATSAEPPPPSGSPPGPPRRWPAGARWLIAVALAVLVGGSVTALALRPAGSHGSPSQAAGPPRTATPTSPMLSSGQVTPSGPTSTAERDPTTPPDPPPPTTGSTTTPPPPPPPARLTLDSPTPGATLRSRTTASGTASRLGSGDTIWVFLYSADIGDYYIVSREGVIVADGSWHGPIGANPNEPGDYRLYAVIVDAADGQALTARAGEPGSPYLKALPRSVGGRQVHIDVHCCS